MSGPSHDPRKAKLEALADVNRKAARSGDKEALYASQKALAEALNEINYTPFELKGTDLSGIDLSGYRGPIRCRLDAFHFRDANLGLVDFSGSTFSDITFLHTVFDRTLARGVNFSNCLFHQAIIDDADFSHARIRNCHLVAAIFRQYPQVTGANLFGSYVSRPFYDYLKEHVSEGSLPKVRG